MDKDQRQQLIIEELRVFNKIRSIDISKKLDVSEDTIRRDLKELSEMGLLKKVHGGAMSSSPISISPLEDLHEHDSKVTIVKKALTLLENDLVIIIDGGSTNLELAKLLPTTFRGTVFTNSLRVALLLSEHPEIELNLLGGRLFKKSKVTTGVDAIHYLNEIHADISFLGMKGIHPNIGITENSREEALIKREIISRSRKIVTLCISEKLGKIQPFKVDAVQKINVLITELATTEPVLVPYHNAGLHVL
jgi:DeoR/GlpR family transcriptional regulator of sugar metabolism